MQKFLRRLAVGAVAVVSSTAVIGAGVSASHHTPAASSSSKPLVIGLATGAQMNWWPPLQSATACGDLFGGGGLNGPQPYQPLLMISGKDQIDYSASLASKITPSDGNKVFTVTLNPKWHWSNGQAVTAAQVAYEWELIKASTASSSTFAYCFVGTGGVPTMWKSVVATGADTFRVTLAQSVNPQWFELNGLSQLTAIPPILQKYGTHYSQELNWLKSISNSPMNPVYQVVDGPYRIAKVVPNNYWKYVANPHYNGPNKPKIKTVIFQYESSESSTFLGLRNGTLAFATLPFSYYAEAKKLPGYKVVPEPFFGFTGLTLNQHAAAGASGKLFSQLYIRQALQMGINQPQYVKGILHGLGVVNYSPVPNKPSNAYENKAIGTPYAFNPAKGKKLLEAHGWKMKNGVMQKGGQSLAFTMMYDSGNTALQDEAELMQQAWLKEGVKVSLAPQNPQTLSGIVGTPSQVGKWQMALGVYGWGYGPDFYPSGDGIFNTGAGYNIMGYSSSGMDHLISLTATGGGSAAQIKAQMNAYLAYAAKQLPVLWLPNADDLEVVSTHLKNFTQDWNTVQQFVPTNDLAWK